MMNAFTWILALFPFYLAVNGKLTAYMALA